MPVTRITNLNAVAVGDQIFEVDASDLDLAPGQFPDSFETSLGNKNLFLKDHEDFQFDGELNYVAYRQRSSFVELRIFND
jgi:hypothetical protein